MVRPELRDYIERTLKMGYSIDVIRDTLLKAGWPSADVEEGIAEILRGGTEKEKQALPKPKPPVSRGISSAQEEQLPKQQKTAQNVLTELTAHEKQEEPTIPKKPIIPLATGSLSESSYRSEEQKSEKGEEDETPAHLSSIISKEDQPFYQSIKNEESKREELKREPQTAPVTPSFPVNLTHIGGAIVLLLLAIVLLYASITFIAPLLFPSPVSEEVLSFAVVPRDALSAEIITREVTPIGGLTTLQPEHCRAVLGGSFTACLLSMSPSGTCTYVTGTIPPSFSERITQYEVGTSFGMKTYTGNGVYGAQTMRGVVQCDTAASREEFLALLTKQRESIMADAALRPLFENISSPSAIRFSRAFTKIGMFSDKDFSSFTSGSLIMVNEVPSAVDVTIRVLTTDSNRLVREIRQTFALKVDNGEEPSLIQALNASLRIEKDMLTMSARDTTRAFSSAFEKPPQTLETRLLGCEIFSDEQKRAQCYQNIINTIRTSDDCAKVRVSPWMRKCYLRFCTTYDALSSCSLLPGNERDECIVECLRTVSSRDLFRELAWCEKIESESVKSTCFGLVAQDFRYWYACLGISSRNERERCLISLNASITQCDALSTAPQRETCYLERLITLPRDEALARCASFSQLSLRQKCLLQASELPPTVSIPSLYTQQSATTRVSLSPSARDYVLSDEWGSPTVKIVVGSAAPLSDYRAATRLGVYLANRAYRKSSGGDSVVTPLSPFADLLVTENEAYNGSFILVGTPSTSRRVAALVSDDDQFEIKNIGGGLLIAGENEFYLQSNVTAFMRTLERYRGGEITYKGVPLIDASGKVVAKIVVGSRATPQELLFASNLAVMLANRAFRPKTTYDQEPVFVMILDQRNSPLVISDAWKRERPFLNRYLIVGARGVNTASPVSVAKGTAVIDVYSGDLVIAGGTADDTARAVDEYLAFLSTKEKQR